MPTYRTATVTGVLGERRGLQQLSVRMQDGTDARAYAIGELTGTCAPGDRVICNTTAVELGLGTGGWHFVHWNLERDSLVSPGPDHVMKIRYTSLQADVGTSELLYPDEADKPLDGTPVVVCTLHSQAALVALGFARSAPGRRLVYVMTDGAALPIAMSDLVARLTDADLLAGTVTAGHAFGGDLEAVGFASALSLAAHVLDADAIVAAMGPGVVGTGTAMGTTALEAAPMLDLAERRGGRPLLCVRASDGDSRGRHRGVSHHVHSLLDLCGVTPAVADVPAALDDRIRTRCEVLPVEQPPDATEAMESAGIEVTTMGRGPDADPTFFAAAIGAGILAGSMCT